MRLPGSRLQLRRSLLEVWREQASERLTRAMEPHFARSLADPECPRGFLGAELLDVAQQDHAPMIFGHAIEGGANQLAVLPALEQRLGARPPLVRAAGVVPILEELRQEV